MKDNPLWLLAKEGILVFILFWALVLLMFLLPYDKQYGYSQMLESCGKSEWLYNRIFINETPIDIALIGSSRTLCGLRDSLLEKRLTEKHHLKTNVANLAFCRYGRPLHFVILKDLFENQHPVVLVLEVRETESRFSHPDFAFIAASKDLLPPVLHESYFKQVLRGARARTDFYLKRMVGLLPLPDTSGITNNYFYFESSGKADTLLLNKTKQTNKIKGKKNIGFDWQYSFSKKYLKNIFMLATKNNVKIYFLYLPSYASQFDLPHEHDFYSQYGELLIPPNRILENSDFWADEVHLNQDGAIELTDWLSQKIH